MVSAASGRAETLTIATYNIENYGPANRLTEGGYRKDYPKPEPEKRALRAVIRALRADVLVVQEMGGQAYLDELRRDLKNEGLDYPHAALATAADADRHIAVLSLRPLVRVTTHDDLAFSYFGAKEKVKRGLLEVAVTTVAGEVTLFAVHLKSRFTDRPDDPMSAVRRGAEATAVRDRILKRFPSPAESRVVVLGDCNDGRSSRTLAHLIKRGERTVLELLPAADSRGEAWTHVYRREESYTHVDHVLVSPGLRAAVPGGVARIYDGEGVREASDHRPVMITLVLEAKR
ncbi:MAG: endonuclease/exonuclease/phosphatase family protein [Verrucomicrobia bacterium]|nr:endonuclease/exonuclease/phosphatase family protein [Verrucomicrobiota bacterium]